MNCHDAAQYASALCDGEAIPQAAAEHLGGCEECRARLNDYMQMGAELRLLASLAEEQPLTERTWAKQQRRSTWFSKGLETMRIPKFAFALLLLAIVGLSSGLVIVRARAQKRVAVLMMTANAASGETLRCTLSLSDNIKNDCRLIGPKLLVAFRAASTNGDEIKLGVRAKAEPGSIAYDAVESIPEQFYSFHPGQELHIEVPGSGRMVVTGDVLDHMPPLLGMVVKTDPDPNKLQVVSPLLIRDKKVIFDLKGASSAGDMPTVQIYMPGYGLWTLSQRPVAGATEGKVEQNRVSFELNGHSYMLVSGVPVARAERIWVLHDPKFASPAAFIGGAEIGEVSVRQLN